jgi:hypothetical protein
LASGYILETAHWLCDVEAKGGGWGIEAYDDTSHHPISGEVAYALSLLATRDEQVDGKLAKTKEYFSEVLDQTPRSVVHLCWIVLGSLACEIPLEDERIEALLSLLEDADREGWAWSLTPKDDGERAIYPTYLALLVLHEARQSSRPTEVHFEKAGIWLRGLRASDLLWGDPNDPPGRRVVESAYAILGLYHAYRPDQFELQVADSLPVLSKAALSLPPNQAVFVEQPQSNPGLPPWHHCVVPQVAWTRLRILGPDSEVDDTPLPGLLSKCVDDMWQADKRNWLDPTRRLSAPYLAADMLRVLTAYSREIDSRLIIPELAIRMENEMRKAEELDVQLKGCEEQDPVVPRRYDYESRHLGLSTPVYVLMVLVMTAAAAVLAVATGSSSKGVARLAVVLLGFGAYLPLEHALKPDRAIERFGLFAGAATVVGVAATLGVSLVAELLK